MGRLANGGDLGRLMGCRGLVPVGGEDLEGG